MKKESTTSLNISGKSKKESELISLQDLRGLFWIDIFTKKDKEALIAKAKRTFDILFSLLVILFVFPIIFPLIALAIIISSPGPVFFIQRRTGLNNREFNCYKFRTMVVNNESDVLQAASGDPRVTALGKFLRNSNLDELPQFINVLKGEMSVVGPRPHMLKHTEEYSRLISNYMLRHTVKPGITGWAQINGFRGPTSELESMEKRVKMDLWYLKNMSLMIDLKIILLTVHNMITGDKNAV